MEQWVQGLQGFLTDAGWAGVLAAASLVVGLLAGLIVSPLIAIAGERLRDFFFHLDIRAEGILSTVQTPVIVTRLLVKNHGSVSARDVEAHVEEIWDRGEKRENFAPVPLRWMHGQARQGAPSVRDIHGKQPSYLDIADVWPTELAEKCFLLTELAEKFCLLLCVSVDAARRHDQLMRLWEGQSTLVIAIYNASGRVTRVQLSVEWDGTWTEPDVSIAS